MALAARTGAVLRFAEVRCSDLAEHRRQVEDREPEMPGHGVPAWEQVLRRRYEPWPQEPSGRIVIDNIGDPSRTCRAHCHRAAGKPAGWDLRQHLT